MVSSSLSLSLSLFVVVYTYYHECVSIVHIICILFCYNIIIGKLRVDACKLYVICTLLWYKNYCVGKPRVNDELNWAHMLPFFFLFSRLHWEAEAADPSALHQESAMGDPDRPALCGGRACTACSSEFDRNACGSYCVRSGSFESCYNLVWCLSLRGIYCIFLNFSCTCTYMCM